LVTEKIENFLGLVRMPLVFQDLGRSLHHVVDVGGPVWILQFREDQNRHGWGRARAEQGEEQNGKN